MNRPYSHYGDRNQPYFDQKRHADRDPGLAPGSYQNDPDHHGSHGGYWEREDTYGRNDRGFFEKASDEVQSWFGDEDAEQRRERDHRGKGPRNYQRSDERIAEDVHQRLADDHDLDGSVALTHRKSQAPLVCDDGGADGTAQESVQTASVSS